MPIEHEILRRLRENDPSLISLDLTNQNLDNSDASSLASALLYRALLYSLPYNTHLRILNIRSNPKIDSSSIENLIEAIERNPQSGIVGFYFDAPTNGNPIKECCRASLQKTLVRNHKAMVMSKHNLSDLEIEIGIFYALWLAGDFSAEDDKLWIESDRVFCHGDMNRRVFLGLMAENELAKESGYGEKRIGYGGSIAKELGIGFDIKKNYSFFSAQRKFQKEVLAEMEKRRRRNETIIRQAIESPGDVIVNSELLNRHVIIKIIAENELMKEAGLKGKNVIIHGPLADKVGMKFDVFGRYRFISNESYFQYQIKGEMKKCRKQAPVPRERPKVEPKEPKRTSEIQPAQLCFLASFSSIFGNSQSSFQPVAANNNAPRLPAYTNRTEPLLYPLLVEPSSSSATTPQSATNILKQPPLPPKKISINDFAGIIAKSTVRGVIDGMPADQQSGLLPIGGISYGATFAEVRHQQQWESLIKDCLLTTQVLSLNLTEIQQRQLLHVLVTTLKTEKFFALSADTRGSFSKLFFEYKPQIVVRSDIRDKVSISNVTLKEVFEQSINNFVTLHFSPQQPLASAPPVSIPPSKLPSGYTTPVKPSAPSWSLPASQLPSGAATPISGSPPRESTVPLLDPHKEKQLRELLAASLPSDLPSDSKLTPKRF